MFSFNFARPLGSLFLRPEGGIAEKGKFPTPCKTQFESCARTPFPNAFTVRVTKERNKKSEVCSVKRVARSSRTPSSRRRIFSKFGKGSEAPPSAANDG